MAKEKVRVRLENLRIGIMNEIIVQIPAGKDEVTRQQYIEDEVLQAVTERVRYSFVEV